MLSFDFFKHYFIQKNSHSIIRLLSRLSFVGMTVGVASLIIVMSVMSGLNRNIRERLLRFEPHLVITLTKDNSFEQIKEILDSEHLREKVKDAHISDQMDVLVRTVDGTVSGAQVKGLPADAIERLPKRADLRGENLKDGEIYMGIDLARSLGVYEGDRVTLVAPESLLAGAGQFPMIEKVTVKGFFSTQSQDYDASTLVYDQKNRLKKLAASKSVVKVLNLYVNNPEKVDDVAKVFKDRGVKIETWYERNSSLFFALRMEKMAMAFFLSLATIITAFSIVMVLVLLVSQKKKEMAILMAMGMSWRSVRFWISQMGFWISVGGVFVGALIGTIVSWLIDRYPISLLPDIYIDSTLPADIHPMLVIQTLVGALFLSLFVSWLASFTIAKREPSYFLRSK